MYLCDKEKVEVGSSSIVAIWVNIRYMARKKNTKTKLRKANTFVYINGGKNKLKYFCTY